MIYVATSVVVSYQLNINGCYHLFPLLYFLSFFDGFIVKKMVH